MQEAKTEQILEQLRNVERTEEINRFLQTFLNGILCFVIVLLFLLTRPISAAQGPLTTNNTHPVNRLFLNPVFETAEVINYGTSLGSIGIDYGSVNINKQSDKWDILMDMEFAILTLSFKMGLSWQTEGTVSLPLVYYFDGFMDPFLKWYHNTLGVSNYGREKRPNNDFGYRVRKNGKDWFRPTNGGCGGVGDGTISLKKCLVIYGDTRLSMKGMLKAPTGDSGRGLGSGGFDAGIMLLFRQGFDAWILHLGVGHEWLGSPDTQGGFDPGIRDTTDGSFALEYIWSDKLSLLAQIEGKTSPFSDTGIESLDKGFIGLTFGGKYRLRDDTGIELAFSEDLSEAASDFTIHIGMVFDF